MASIPESFKLEARFAGFTNSTFSAMFIEHLQNGQKSTNPHFIPAQIEVKNPELVELTKQLTTGSKIEIVVKRKHGPYGLAAELLEIKVLELKAFPTTTKTLKPLPSTTKREEPETGRT